jgi:hypothetical protein
MEKISLSLDMIETAFLQDADYPAYYYQHIFLQILSGMLSNNAYAGLLPTAMMRVAHEMTLRALKQMELLHQDITTQERELDNLKPDQNGKIA